MGLENEAVVNADGDFFDFMFNMEKSALEEIGDEETLKMQEADRKAAMNAYMEELEADGLKPKDVA